MREFISRTLKKSYDLGQYAPLYQSTLVSLLKILRSGDRDYRPNVLDFGTVRFHIARHFGFCKGVENAIEMAYQTLEKYPNRRVFMVSELIHNDFVNEDLYRRGLRFIKTSSGKQLIPWEDLNAEDVVLVPAFGATVEDKEKLRSLGIEPNQWDATCRFVENVWFRAEEVARKGFTIIVHGKWKHEETQATVSYCQQFAPVVVVLNEAEANILGEIIKGVRPLSDFELHFRNVSSPNFDPAQDLQKVAVVNQTTMLASETAEISQYFKNIMAEKHGAENANYYIADTRDTLCYATKNNQTSTLQLLDIEADLAIVIGGRKSSNTTHLVEICEEKFPTYFIRSEEDLQPHKITHYDFRKQEELYTENFLPQKSPLNIILSSGASCPDTIIERVMQEILSYYPDSKSQELVLAELKAEYSV